MPAPLYLTPALSEVILRILRIEVGVCEWRAEVQVLVPVVLDELVIPVIGSDPYQDLALDILVEDKPATVVVLYSLPLGKPLYRTCVFPPYTVSSPRSENVSSPILIALRMFIATVSRR
jgi:hypothetical protein